MAKRSKVAQEAFELAEPVVTELGFDLVDCSYVKEARGMVLTLYIDKRGGIGIDDCETVQVESITPFFPSVTTAVLHVCLLSEAGAIVLYSPIT